MLAVKQSHATEEISRDAIRIVTVLGDGVSETARHLGINAPL
jgi:hypothetical protein